jgi:hypothetical protein
MKAEPNVYQIMAECDCTYAEACVRARACVAESRLRAAEAQEEADRLASSSAVRDFAFVFGVLAATLAVAALAIWWLP